MSVTIKQPLQSQSGFTLIELAIVLIIIAVLLGSFIGTLATRIENTRVSEVKDELEEIKQALIGYAYVNSYLPCPDSDNDGLENRAASGLCTIGVGVGDFPWVDLGIARGDTWNTRYRYWVHSFYADDGTGGGNVFALGSPNGAGIIQEPDYVTDPTGATLENMAVNVVAVVFSHGKNTFGGRSIAGTLSPAIPAANADELENTDANGIFVDRTATTEDATTAGGEFDDILIWLSEYELKAKMVEAGVLP